MHSGPKKGQGMFGQLDASNDLGSHRLSYRPNTCVIPHNSPYSTNMNKISDKKKSYNPSSIQPSNSIKADSLNKNLNKSISLASNEGPKRGHLFGSNSIHNCSIIEANKAAGKKTIVPLLEDANGKLRFVQNEGPKRGISIGQSAFHQNKPQSSQNGPRRGVGYMNITNQFN